ncbi:MAG TPA: orotate phosphoribosyltransferase [Gemmatimonadota bacterium]|nr:orotate phosphoribosyltransferase [Gemmatimonadota bacterium]
MQELLEELRAVIARQSVRHGDFTLASGAKSRYYIDLRATTLSPRGARLTGEVLCRLLEERDVEAVGGLALGAAFVATAVAVVSDLRGRPIPGFTVRSEAKGHGMKKAIEESWSPDGRPLVSEGRRVAVVDDVVTTGGSTLRAIEAVRAAGAEIALVVAIVDRRQGGGDRLRETGLPYVAIFEADSEGELTVALEQNPTGAA